MEIKIPKQRMGGHSDTVSRIKLKDAAAAKKHFAVVKMRFYDVNNWHRISGNPYCVFKLYDSMGHPQNREPQQGDYFRIDVRAFVNFSDTGSDWVRVEEISGTETEDEESAYIRVRPAEPPTENTAETEHFFYENATSNFIIKRQKNIVTAEVHGRNEKPNVKHVGWLEKVRNTVMALGGMLFGSKMQWKKFTKGLIKTDQ